MADIQDRLKRELLRSPKKTVILAVMFVVAIYFWAPLVFEWVNPETSTTVAQAKDVPATTDVSIPAPVVPRPPRRRREYEWNDLTRAIENDPLMQPGSLAVAVANPFATLSNSAQTQSLIASDPDSPDVAEQGGAVEMVTPRSLGLTLRGTFVGKDCHIANISGRSYRQGAELRVPLDEDDEGKFVTMKVVSVTPTSVVLTRNGARWTLTLQQTVLAGHDYIHIDASPGN